jgi:hypothetical protein
MGEGRAVYMGFWLGSPKARNHWEDLGVGGRITLRWILGRYGSMRLAEDRVQWRAFVNTVMKLRIP